MIDRFVARDHRCLKDVEIALTPLHCLIGPNDSGKSTILRAIETVASLASGWVERRSLPPGGSVEVRSHAGTYGLAMEAGVLSEVVHLPGSPRAVSPRDPGHPPGGRGDERQAPLFAAVGRPLYLRLDPDALRAASSLIVEGQPIRFTSGKGGGLPGVYDVLINRGDDTWQRIRDDVRQMFPALKNVRLRNASADTKQIEAELRDGTRVSAEHMSEGLLYYLAFAAVSALDDVDLLLVEEPENGLHPSRIAEVVHMLRALTERGTQVLMSTHSPLVVNELRPEEVTVLTRHPTEGTKAHPIASTPDFARRSAVYALGELWLAYANGDDEAPLLTGTQG